MGSPQATPTVVNLREALGINGACLSRYNVPAGLHKEQFFGPLLLALIGCSESALQSGSTQSEWEPRQVFLNFAHGAHKISYLNTLVWAASIYYKCPGIKASDFELLHRLVNFVERYSQIPQEALQDARIEINLRANSKKDEAAWTDYNRNLRQHERYCFFQKRGPVLQVQGVPPEEIQDVLETEWAEYSCERRRAWLNNPHRTGRLVPFPKWPTGITYEEKAYGRAVAQGLLEGEGRNWLIRTQLRESAYPNQFSDEEFFRLAAYQLWQRGVQPSSPAPPPIPHPDSLTRAEKAAVRLLRNRVLQGREIGWDQLENRQGPHYPNRLSKIQLLCLAARLPPTEPPPPQTPPREEEDSDAAYFSASDE